MTKPEDIDPAAALDSIRQAQAGVSRSLDYPIYWDFLYALIVAVMVGGAGLDQPWSVLTLLASLAGLGLMVRWWRERFGWWVNGYAPPRARWVAIGMAAVLMGLMGLSFWRRLFDGPWWAPLVAGGLAWIVAIIGGRMWMRVFRKEIERSTT